MTKIVKILDTNPHVSLQLNDMPTSDVVGLSCWFRQRFGSGGKRLRRIGIVAVARKLLIALWRFLETGVIPAGAVLKEV